MQSWIQEKYSLWFEYRDLQGNRRIYSLLSSKTSILACILICIAAARIATVSSFGVGENALPSLTEKAPVLKDQVFFDNTILLTMFNLGYFDLFSNLVATLKAVGLNQYLHAAVSAKDFATLQNDTKKNYILDDCNFYIHNYSVQSNAAGFGWGSFTLVTAVKLETTYDFLVKGYDVLFIDGDIGVIRDFRDAVVEVVDNLNESYHAVFQHDVLKHRAEKQRVLNTGFFWVRSDNFTLKIFNVSEKVRKAPFSLGREDQMYLNRHFKCGRDADVFNATLFPNGKMVKTFYNNSIPALKETAYIMHANFDFHKARFLKRMGMWKSTYKK